MQIEPVDHLGLLLYPRLGEVRREQDLLIYVLNWRRRCNDRTCKTAPDFLHGAAGQRQLREVLSAQLIALIMQPEPIWLVSPWVSNFSLLDNRSGNWDSIDPAWGGRELDFIELLACAVNNGAPLSLVTRDEPMNRIFVKALEKRLSNFANFRLEWRNQLHIKVF